MSKGGNWQPKTEGSYRATLDIFFDLFDNLDITSVDSNMCREFKDKIQNLPKNHNKVKKYRDLPASKLVLMDIPKTDRISLESVNKHIIRISSFLDWAMRQQYISSNPIKGMQIRTSSRGNKQDKRLPFTSEDLNTLFSDELYLGKTPSKSYYFWLPLIALFTGARIQEICQLELVDIYEVDGNYIFDINNKGSQKRLKNEGSARLIPVHQKLIDIGFVRQLNRLNRLGKKYLFPELHTDKNNRDGQSQSASKWFGRFKQKHGFPADGKKAFHSFRHSFIDELKRKNTPEHITASLVGHAHDNITYGTYGSPDEIKQLKTHVEKIQYDGVNLSRLTWKPQ